MALTVSAIANCDDAVVFWKIDKALPNCWGFAIEREQTLADGSVKRTVLDNRTGFEKDKPKSGDHRPSIEWPFQRFNWADHSVNSGDRVRYRVVPMIHDGAQLQQDVGQRSAWTKWLELSGNAGHKTAAFFNRGLVISQFMARYLEKLRVDHGLEDQREALVKFKADLEAHERPIRVFLSGILRTEMLRLLEDARKTKGHVFGALYELEDDELVKALGRLGARGHLVLANGSITKKKGETSEDARKRDQNQRGRAELRAKKLEIHDRMVSPGALGHNKFLVVTGASGKSPRAVWTGSTNWTATGLCTQINNGLLVENGDFAKVYFDQWARLRDAKSAFPQALVDANSKPKTASVGGSRAEVWFSRTSGSVDLRALDDIVKEAEQAVLFLMFQPGGAATLGSIRKRLDSPGNLYIKGVVSTLPADDADDADHVDATVVGDGQKHRVGVDIVQPEGINAFASWAAAVTRKEFIPTSGGVVGFAIVHSKLIVVDPFTRPVVVTGSHNFSGSASTKNDENFVVIRKNSDLALEYAAHILAVYQHYRWLSFVHDMQKRGKNPKGFLQESPDWQQRHLKGAAKKEIEFWTR